MDEQRDKDYCGLYNDMAFGFLAMYRKAVKEPWPEGADYEDIDFDAVLEHTDRLGGLSSALTASLPQRCGKCRYCGDKAIEAGDACPTCGRRHDDG